MRIFLTLFQKEWLEAWRDKKLIWLPIVMIILAVSQPISYYYMEDILAVAGNLPEGAVIDIPVPTGEEVLSSILSQFDLIGIAIVILSVMGAISNERNSGALSLVMARPVQPLQYIASKWLVQALILIMSFGVGYLFAYYYVVLLFNEVPFTRLLISFAIYCLWIIFAMTLTIFVGTWINKTGGIAGVSLMIVAALYLSNSIFPKFMKWNPANASRETNYLLVTGNFGDSLYLMVITSCLLILILVVLAVLRFSRFAKYN